MDNVVSSVELIEVKVYYETLRDNLMLCIGVGNLMKKRENK